MSLPVRLTGALSPTRLILSSPASRRGRRSCRSTRGYRTRPAP